MPSSVVIADKDGGILTELRGGRGDLPVYLAASGDGRNYWTEKIDITATGDNTIHTPATGKRFYVTNLTFSTGVSGEVLFKSGTTDISGPMNLAAYGGISVAVTNPTDPPLLQGSAINNAFVLMVRNAATMDVGGFCSGYDE